MPKRSLAGSEAIWIFDANTAKPDDYVTLLKRQVLSAAAEEEVIRKAAKEFTLDEAVQDFRLTYNPKLSESARKIEELPDVKTFQPSACLVSLLENYTETHD